MQRWTRRRKTDYLLWLGLDSEDDFCFFCSSNLNQKFWASESQPLHSAEITHYCWERKTNGLSTRQHARMVDKDISLTSPSLEPVASINANCFRSVLLINQPHYRRCCNRCREHSWKHLHTKNSVPIGLVSCRCLPSPEIGVPTTATVSIYFVDIMPTK